MNKYQTQEDEIVNWEMIFDMLSMDRVEPFLPEMGLRLSNVNAIRAIARQFVEQCHLLQGDVNLKKILVKKTFTEIGRSIDDSTAQAIYQWGNEIFPVGTQKGYLYWIMLIGWLAGLTSRYYPVILPPFDQAKVTAIAQSMQENFGDILILEDRIEKAEQLPRSSWDDIIYNSSEDGFSPLTTASNTIQNYRFFQVWKTIKALLTDDELIILLQWAKEHAPHLQINPELINLPI
jgi:hypothetical protein